MNSDDGKTIEKAIFNSRCLTFILSGKISNGHGNHGKDTRGKEGRKSSEKGDQHKGKEGVGVIGCSHVKNTFIWDGDFHGGCCRAF